VPGIKKMATSLRRTLVQHIFAPHKRFMQQQIASYLFQNKTCPLPGFGTLSLSHSTATLDFTDRSIRAPKPIINFENAETDTTGLLNYLAATTGADQHEASTALDHFCDDLKKEMAEQSNVKLDNIGNFSVDSSGKISFTPEELPPVFLQPVHAERVIHPDAEHQILVGDKEKTNTQMTELLAPKTAAKDRWWIWAIVLGVISVLLLVIYFAGDKGNAAFGNAINYIHS
jgi:nucleoid DNA-binding protein